MLPIRKQELLLLVSVALSAGCLASASTFIVEYQPNQLTEIESQLSARGYSVVRQYPSFNRLVVSGGDLAGTASTPGSGSFNPDELVRQVSAELAGLGGVDGVAKGGMRRLFPQPVISGTYYNYQDSQDQQSGVMCNDADGKLGPDADLGRSKEGVPYGIHMVQADDAAMIEVSKKYKNKVLFCVIDTGLDPTNTEFNNATTSGCMPGFPNDDANKPYKYCYNWFNDANRHGTHTSGTIAALRNGQGVVGVSAEGAQVYHYNYFGPNMEASDDLEVAAWQECIAELDRRKVSTSTPDMKLVISMSYGSYAETEFSKAAISSLTKQRNDVLWIAAAGNSGDNSTNFPAGYDEVISIGAVDWSGKPADFSTYNTDVELSAPGVQTLSTIPLALSNTSDYHFRPYSRDILTTTPPLQDASADFNKPEVNRVDGTPTGNVTAGLVNCGLANNGTCQGVEGKVCLIQRGNNTFCDKILNCAAGGGVGVIIYNRDDVPECEALTGVSVELCGSAPGQGWPLVVTTSSRQGKALAAALTANPQLNTTINVVDLQPQSNFGLELLSGTSMATPTASGVAGLVWSAHTKCTAAEIREALIKTAWKPDNSTGRDQHYGHGVVQAKAAHDYLTANACKGPKLNVTMQITAGRGMSSRSSSSKSSNVRVRVTVADSSTGRPVAAQRVRLEVKPSRKAMTCSTYVLTTNNKGVASTNCIRKKAGKVTLTAEAGDASATSSLRAD